MLAPFGFYLWKMQEIEEICRHTLKLSAQSMQKKIKEDTSILDEK
jgi:hypothetical protein